MKGAVSSQGISVIVPSYNCSRFLSRLLVSIDEHRPSDINVEVLVIDDSLPKEAEITKALCDQHRVNYLRCEGNVSRKRNFGIERASHEVVLFTDSDCEIASGSIAEHVKSYQTDRSIDAVCGVVEFTGETNWVWSVVERSSFLGAFSFAKRMPNVPWAVTANLSVKKAVLEQIGGFDEGFLQAPGGEDVDLGLRLNKAGHKIVSNPHSVIYHTRDTWNTVGRMLKRVIGYGRAHYRLLVKHADQVGYEYPRLAVVLFLVGLMLTAQSVLTLDPLPILKYMVFALLMMAMQAVLVLSSSQSTMKPLVILKEMAAHGMDLAFEWAVVSESLRHWDTRGFWAKMIYAEKQLVHERERKIIQSWSVVIGLAILLLLY
jgi:glycosyltransferase involved in cell wall biosynthesis